MQVYLLRACTKKPYVRQC